MVVDIEAGSNEHGAPPNGALRRDEVRASGEVRRRDIPPPGLPSVVHGPRGGAA